MPLPDRSDQGKEQTSSPAPKEETIDKVKKAAKDGRPISVDGLTVDGLTAKTIARVYGDLTPKKREKFARLSIKQMICKAYEIAERG